MLCASNGYNLTFDIYTGKSEGGVQRELGTQVVKKLCHDLRGKQQCFFLTITLLATASSRTFCVMACGMACGMVKQNLPCLQADKVMKRGDADWSVSDDGLCCLKWKDKTTVYLVTNFHDPCTAVEVGDISYSRSASL